MCNDFSVKLVSHLVVIIVDKDRSWLLISHSGRSVGFDRRAHFKLANGLKVKDNLEIMSNLC